MTDKPPVLVVEDDDALREFLVRALKVDGYAVQAAPDAASALGIAEGQEPAVLVAEVFLKGMNGVELVKQLRQRQVSTQVVLIARNIPTYTVVAAMKQGAFDFVEKPIDPDYFLLVVRRAVEHWRLTHENQALRRLSGLAAQDRDGMVAESPSMQDVCKTIELVAPSDLTVLVTGESGVGKELVANRLHALSRRQGKPFVAVNCGAIQETLLESELFGHVKGAFTGAHQDHQGLFEVADGGTLFLDEIGEMNLDLQVKLLRVLETSEFRRVGGTKLVKVMTRRCGRVTNKRRPSGAGGARRGPVLPAERWSNIEVSPARERADDIPALVRAFLEAHHRKGLPRREVSPEALAALTAYPWPGNVRELRNIIERSLILCRGETILADDLPAALVRGAHTEAASRRSEPTYDLATPLAEVERRHILRVLGANGGNKVRTARVLGINVKTLYNKLKAYEGAAGQV
ncbi:MAG: sigma-54-dependent Fis family transcriptional regulator [Planctomycetota bacterium]|nr:sigma-54-dependent Fis family transcriptional regulator [Planctomycetota bacterium]